MGMIKPKGGVNLRLPAYSTPRNQFLLMQNVDMTHEEIFEQIDGCTRYHGTSLGTRPTTAIMPYYNVETGVSQVLAAVDDKIVRRNEGTNQFTTLISNLAANRIRFSMDVGNFKYIAHPDNGYFMYDGNQIEKILTDRFKDVIFVKEVNRAFAIDADIPNALRWTDDISTTANAPIVWPAANISVFHSDEGEEIEKLAFLNGRLVLFMTNSTWIYYIQGAPRNWRPEKSPTVVGWIAPKTIKQVGGEFWGLGHSPATGRGLYGFNGQTSRLLSYDIGPYLDRINENLIFEACAEYVDNLYKLSFAIDSDTENNTTFHVDTVDQNEETELPNFYGPHTYGFTASTVLNTKKYKGEHLFSRTYSNGSWIFKTDKVKTFYGNPAQEDGSLIPVILMTGILMDEQIEGSLYDRTWVKRYSKFFIHTPPRGTWDAKIEILRDFRNETYQDYKQALESGSASLEAIDLGSTVFDLSQFATNLKTLHVLSQGIQIKISNHQVAKKIAIESIEYDARPVRRLKEAQRVHAL